MTGTTCTCGRPVNGTTLCTRCQTTLAMALLHVSEYHTDLETVATKRARFGSAGATKGSIGKAVPMPVDERFVNVPTRRDADGNETGGGPAKQASANMAAYEAWRSTVKWCRRVMAVHPNQVGPTCTACLHASCANIRRNRWPRGAVRPMLAYLDRQFRWIITQDWAPELLEDMLENETRLRRIIDRPADRWYAGKCSATDESGNTCEAELYATAESGIITCPACRTIHDVTARRDFLLAEAKDYHVTATEAAQALIAWTDYDGDETKLVNRIRMWRDRGKLDVADVTSLQGKDRHLYRLGDVQDMLVEAAQRTQTQRLGRAV